MLKVGPYGTAGQTYKFSNDLTYNFGAASIDPSLIPANINISGSNINASSGNKLSGVNITGTIDSSLIGDGPTISSSANITNITGDHKLSEVQILCSVDASNIGSASISSTATITGNGRINYASIEGTISPAHIDRALIVINNDTTIGHGLFSGTTQIQGAIPASNVNDAIINLGDGTSFLTGSKFSGDVTITGIVDAEFIPTPVSLNIIGANLNGSNIIDNSIKSIKLDSDLSLSCASITFSDASILESVADLYTQSDAETNLLSISSNNLFASELQPSAYTLSNIILKSAKINIVEPDGIELPLLYDSITKKTHICTSNSFNSLEDNLSKIEIGSGNNTSNIIIENGNTGGKVTLNSDKLCFFLNDEPNSVFELSGVSNYSIKPLKVEELVFPDGTNMLTGVNTSFYNAEYMQIIMTDETGYEYADSDLSGPGFIHCNGIHARFDITAFSSTTMSDFNLKKNINSLEYNNELLQLEPVTFQWKDSNKSNTSNAGFIAQDIEKIFPDLVKRGLDNYKSVNYISFIPYLVKHIQNLEKRIQKLESLHKY